MLTGIHFLLTYMCNYTCDHCFLYCGPESGGTMSPRQIGCVLEEAEKIGTVEWIYFEGGEPFLFYPLLIESIKAAKLKGFQVGIVTNAYGVLGNEDGDIWLRPLADAGVDSLTVSEDSFHCGEKQGPAKYVLRAAGKLNIPVSTICIDEPFVVTSQQDREKGTPVIGGGAMFRGRAVEKLTTGLPGRPWDELNSCPYEELEVPKRVHVDTFGNVHLCQGLSLGNMWERQLTELIRDYTAARHPICDALVQGGPAQLAQHFQLPHEETYIDECHFCFLMRKILLHKFPEYLGPAQVYGIRNR